MSRWLFALLLGCSSDGPIVGSADAGVEDVAFVEAGEVSSEPATEPCRRSSDVVVGSTTLRMPVPCREFDPLVDLGRPW